jgi:uncharacterized membrane protein YuzA (DUF378 family)
MEITSSLLATLLGLTVGGGLAVNLVALLCKRWFGLESDSVLHTLVLALSGLAGVAEYLLVLNAQLPPQVLGVTSTSIYGFSQAIFKYAKVAGKFFEEVRAYNQSKTATATAAAGAAAADRDVADIDPPASLASDTAPVSQPDF